MFAACCDIVTFGSALALALSPLSSVSYSELVGKIMVASQVRAGRCLLPHLYWVCGLCPCNVALRGFIPAWEAYMSCCSPACAQRSESFVMTKLQHLTWLMLGAWNLLQGASIWAFVLSRPVAFWPYVQLTLVPRMRILVTGLPRWMRRRDRAPAPAAGKRLAVPGVAPAKLLDALLMHTPNGQQTSSRPCLCSGLADLVQAQLQHWLAQPVCHAVPCCVLQ